MTNPKESLIQVIQNFAQNDLLSQSLTFFKTLGYTSERRIEENGSPETFLENYDIQRRFNPERGLLAEWQQVYLLFQLTDEEIKRTKPLFQAASQPIDNSIIESFLFIALELKKSAYSRTDLAKITRAVNQIFAMPAIILFKHGETLTLSVIHRRLHKRDDSKDVLEKVTLLKDIRIANPHRAHLDILNEFALDNLKPNPQNFVELQRAWETVLNTKELNKKFYQELSQWYFWAGKQVTFPNPEQIEKQQYHAQSLIRLLTRLLFVWFVKEKQLIPEELFEKSAIEQFLQAEQDSRYYRAILQNLFFATLNQTRGQRQFRRSGQNMNVTNLLRYQSYFKNPAEFLNLLETVVPFMNGGLFECLDKPIPNKKGKQGGDVIAYIDGFSDREDNVLRVPDFIFFGQHSADLSEELGNTHQSVEIRGLIDILQAYKFTVAENTPLEEDVALDPELLGQVFENLLASYNPETGVTARKQTGSFYTPREIVDYMVDESLVAYFSNIVNDVERLKVLLSYETEKNPFNGEETLKLIQAIDTCKILDPACGSGAFPMGVLHKLVHCLHQLDPNNRLWKERQLEKASSIDDVPIREQLMDDIEAAFTANELDYGRKLYLIENCIYGVDIQAIAVQISKLRFFISLVVDQKVDVQKDNFGIRPLPNLETKFVAANTLIGIKKPELQRSIFENVEIKRLEQQLKEVRHRLFSAKTPKTKRQLREQDEQLRQEIGILLEKHGLEHQTALQLAQWNPYDQNASADFFDSEWMFGVREGFDIVLGNPPYGISLSTQDIVYFKQNYALKSSETAILFIEKGYSLLNKTGIQSYIIPKSFTFASNYGCARDFLEKGLSIIVDCGKAFENVKLEACIIVSKKDVTSDSYSSLKFNDLKFELIATIDKTLKEKFGFYPNGITPKEILLGEKIFQSSIMLNNISQNSRGEILQKYLCKDGNFSVIGGKEIDKYGIKSIKGSLKDKQFITEKAKIRQNSILAQNIIAHIKKPYEHIKITVCIPNNVNSVITDTINQITITHSGYSIQFIWCLLNSKLINWYAHLFIFAKAIRTMHFDNVVTARIPIAKISLTQQQPFITRVDQILALKQQGQDTSELEREIDRLVYQLYDLTEEEIAIVEKN